MCAVLSFEMPIISSGMNLSKSGPGDNRGSEKTVIFDFYYRLFSKIPEAFY